MGHLDLDPSIYPSIHGHLVFDKQEKKDAVIDVAIHSNSNIKKKKQKNFKRYQGQKEEIEKIWRALVLPGVFEAYL